MYRCWVLWSKNYWIMIIPILSAITGLGERILIKIATTQSSPITFGCSISRYRYAYFYTHDPIFDSRPSTSRFQCTMEPCGLHYCDSLECDCDYPHCRAHMVSLPSQETRRARPKLPDKNRSGCIRHHRRERHALSSRAALLHHPLLHPAPWPGYHVDDGRADLRAYSSSDWEIVIDSMPHLHRVSHRH